MARIWKACRAAGFLAAAVVAVAYGAVWPYIEAFMYMWPLVLMSETSRSMLEGGLGANVLQHDRTVKDHTYTQIVRPSVDMLYSKANLDLTEPLVLSLPRSNTNQYVGVQLLDMWTNTAFSSSTTDLAGGDLFICGPTCGFTPPTGAILMRSPTRLALLVVRYQLSAYGDALSATVLQDGTYLRTVPTWQAGSYPQPPTEFVTPEGVRDNVVAMTGDRFYELARQLLDQHPPPPEDDAILPRLEAYGFVGEGVSQPWHSCARGVAKKLMPFIIKATCLRRAEITARGTWAAFQGLGRWGNDYGLRACIANNGLGAQVPEDAVYYSTFIPVRGSARLLLPSAPPVRAFWSLTVYQDNYVAPAAAVPGIGSLTPLTIGEDGSIDIRLQPSAPSAPGVNWLPTPPSGKFTVTARFYLPAPELKNLSFPMPRFESMDPVA